MPPHLPLEQYVLAESLESGAAIHILWPAGYLADDIVKGQCHAAHQQTAAQTLPQCRHALTPMQMHYAGQQLEGVQMIALGCIIDLTLSSQHNERMT